MAVSLDPHCELYREFENAYEFRRSDESLMIGPQPYLVAKETGEGMPLNYALEEGFDCGKQIDEGRIPNELRPVLRGLRDAVYGAAVGDALGVPYEFMERGSFECTGMASGGAHNQPAGTFSDDTSMMLATCDSIRVRGCVDARDMSHRFKDWLHNGAYTADGTVFDFGHTVATALNEGRSGTDIRSNGNGSLMRIAPLAYTSADDNSISKVSAITHAHEISTESCVCFVKLIRNLVGGNTFEDSLRYSLPNSDEFAFLTDVASWPRDKVKSGGYVLDTLGAALWCFANTNSYAECVLAAVNLGGDSDTTACVAGALAGAYYGFEAIPADWLETLRGKDVIDVCLFDGRI